MTVLPKSPLGLSAGQLPAILGTPKLPQPTLAILLNYQDPRVAQTVETKDKTKETVETAAGTRETEETRATEEPATATKTNGTMVVVVATVGIKNLAIRATFPQLQMHSPFPSSMAIPSVRS